MTPVIFEYLQWLGIITRTQGCRVVNVAGAVMLNRRWTIQAARSCCCLHDHVTKATGSQISVECHSGNWTEMFCLQHTQLTTENGGRSSPGTLLVLLIWRV